MKIFLLCLTFVLAWRFGTSQNDFTGIAKYKLTTEGRANSITDSMSVIFNKQKVKVILYLPDLANPGRVSEKVFIDDFAAKTSTVLNNEDKTYKTDILDTSAKYYFFNTQKISATNNILCFQYTADSTKIDSFLLRVDCLASIDYRNSFINNYFFLGIQPIIIDNRIVVDFVVTQLDGIKQRIYISDIKKVENPDSYFDITGYNQEK